MSDLVSEGMQVVLTFGGAYLAAHLAVRNNRRTKWWEKKAEAYSDLLNALHVMKWHAMQELSSAERAVDLAEGKMESLRLAFESANQDVWKVADSASLIVDGRILQAVQKMTVSIEYSRGAKSYLEFAEDRYMAVKSCLGEIKDIGRADLGIN